MSLFGDTEAVFNEERLFAQHQAALSVLQILMADPEKEQFRWLDLACGRGQIILHLKSILPPEARAKLIYEGYDLDNKYVQRASTVADTLGLKSSTFEIGQIEAFSKAYDQETRFDYVTLTNAVHEFSPRTISALFFDAIERLSADGCFFAYDMERLEPLELGAVTWIKEEIQEIINALLTTIVVSNYRPLVGQWHHKTCTGWNLSIAREHFGVPDEILKTQKQIAIEQAQAVVLNLLKRKLVESRRMLDTLSKYKIQTQEEYNEMQHQLAAYYALDRAIRNF